MNADPSTDLWDQLEQALAMQARSLQRGRWRDLESAVDRSGAIVDQITRGDAAAHPVSAARGQRLVRTYEQLMLMAEAQKQTISQQFQRLRSSRRALDAYRPAR
jgi:hypothetical protein